MIPVEILGVHPDAGSGATIVLLAEVNEVTRVLPIFVGAAEAQAIAIGLAGIELPRPLTHDLIVNLMAALGAEITALEVTGLRDGTFLAELEVRANGERQRVDSRPSDGLAIATRLGIPISVSAEVLDEAGVMVEHETDEPFSEEEVESIVAEFSDFLATASASDFADIEGLQAPEEPEELQAPEEPEDSGLEDSQEE